MTRKKQRLYNKARRTDNPSDWKKFKELRKCVKKQLTTAHSEYVSDLFRQEPRTLFTRDPPINNSCEERAAGDKLRTKFYNIFHLSVA